MRALICGSRDYADIDAFLVAMDSLHGEHGFTSVISGSRMHPDDVAMFDFEELVKWHRFDGADALAIRWAIRNRMPAENFPANWTAQGPAAGPIRNQEMLDEGKPDVVIAFPGGKGTADMVRKAKKAGVWVIEVTS